MFVVLVSCLTDWLADCGRLTNDPIQPNPIRKKETGPIFLIDGTYNVFQAKRQGCEGGSESSRKS